MRLNYIMVGTFLVFALIAKVGSAQQPYDIVYQLYYNIMISPSNGDAIIAQNKKLFDNRFYSCMNELLSKFQKYALEHYKFCRDVHVDATRYANCAKENEPAKFHHWLRTMVAVTRGEQSWSQSVMGRSAMLGERFLGNTYVELQRTTIPTYRSYLLCD